MLGRQYNHSYYSSRLKYFLEIQILEGKINTIFGPVDLIEGFRRDVLLLVSGTQLIIQNALYRIRSKRNLLSFNF